MTGSHKRSAEYQIPTAKQEAVELHDRIAYKSHRTDDWHADLRHVNPAQRHQMTDLRLDRLMPLPATRQHGRDCCDDYSGNYYDSHDEDG